MRKNQKNGQKKNGANGLPGKRGDETRQMILAAARQVFAAHPYNAASIRMIANKGDFYHGLIRYHFPNKASIFEAVVKDACCTLYHANKKWLREVSAYGPDQAKTLSTYLDRFIEFSLNHHEVFRIIINNLSHDDLTTLPGHQHLVSLLTDSQRDFEEIFPGLFSGNDTSRFLFCLNALTINFLGAGTVEAKIMGFPERNEAYFQWVKETLLFIFLPVLENARSESS